MKKTLKFMMALWLAMAGGAAVAQDATDVNGIADLKANQGGMVKLTLLAGTVVYGAVSEYSGDYLYLWDGQDGTRVSMPVGTLTDLSDYVGKTVSGSVTGSYAPQSPNGNTILGTTIELTKGEAADLVPQVVTIADLKASPATYAYSYVKVQGNLFYVQYQERLYDETGDYLEVSDIHYQNLTLSLFNNQKGAFAGPFYHSPSRWGDEMKLGVISANFFESEGMATPTPVTLDATAENDLSKEIPLATVTINNLSYEAGNLAVLSVPFNMSAARIESVFGEGTELYSLDTRNSEITADGAYFVFQKYDYSTYGSYGTAVYLIKPTKSVANPTFTAVQISANPYPGYSSYQKWDYSTYTHEDITFRGPFAPTPLATDGTRLLPAADGTLTAATAETAMVNAFSGFFEVPADIAAARVMLPGDVITAISEVEQSRQSSGQTYNLSGMRVSAPVRGLYVKDGRKVVAAPRR